MLIGGKKYGQKGGGGRGLSLEMSVFWGVFFSFLHLDSLFFTFLGEFFLFCTWNYFFFLLGITFFLSLGEFSLFSRGAGLY